MDLTKPGKPPLIRIGLTTNSKEIRISSTDEFYVLEKTSESSRKTVRGEIDIRMEGEKGGATIYRVQVAALANAEAADSLANELRDRFGRAGTVRDGNAGLIRVRVGEFPTREQAQSFAAGPLAQAGYRNALIVREEGEIQSGRPRLALRGPRGMFLVNPQGFLIQPPSQSGFLRLNGKPYRGNFDVTLKPNGTMVIVNQLEMEAYLRGVIPAEMPPGTYPELAALSAQAIAARTYALKNLGRFQSEGYDLTPDDRSQVYEGVSFEHDLTNKAIEATRGLALYYQGNLIEAMYSSTCGGKTEDFALVFDTPPVPYLTSVFCSIEDKPSQSQKPNLTGNHDLAESVTVDDGTIGNRNLELARILGIAEDRAFSAEELRGSATAREIHQWMERTFEVLRRNPREALPPPSGATTRAGFIRYAAELFFGKDELARKVSAGDAEYFLKNLRDGAQVPDASRLSMAYLLQRKLWQARPDNSAGPLDPIRRCDALNLLIRWLESGQAFVLRQGTLTSETSASDQGPGHARAITIKSGKQVQQFPLGERLRLFQKSQSRSIASDAIHVIGGEKLYFLLDKAGRVDFLEVELNSVGAASDRFSPQSSWSVTLARAAIAEKLRPLAENIGDLQDIMPAKIGNSGRAVQIRLEGKRSSKVVNGYRVRRALSLKDTLFTITRNRSADGEIESFTFDGRGWGHGIGLCQTGAAGMARAGRSFEEILKNYYTGVEIRKAY